MPLAVCATPIGNLDDVTLRVLRELAEADAVLCEDTRQTRVLLDRHGIEARGCSATTSTTRRARSASSCRGSRRASGSRSSATPACPAINDPGARLIAAALEAGVPVTVLPGPSAVETALVASGLGGRAVPVRRLSARGREGARRALGGARGVAAPRRRVRVAAAAAARRSRRLADGAARAAGRRLPRADEAVRGGRARDRARELAARFAEPPKGEITLVLGGTASRSPAASTSEAVAAVAELVAAGVPRRQAADVVARLTRRLAQHALPPTRCSRI